MKKYLITLTPTGRFFFGGDMTFTVGDKEKGKDVNQELHNKLFSSYIIHSFKFPQQTSLLGMLRFLLLSNDKIAFDKGKQKIINGERATNLIGSKSFSVNISHHEKNISSNLQSHDHVENIYGDIQRLGSCFLYDVNKRKRYFQAPADFSLSIGKYEDVVCKASLNGKMLQIPTILKDKEVYSSKMELSEEYIFVKDGEVEILKDDDVFKEDERIGIRKNADGKTEDNAFYKQIGYKMGQSYFSFAFMVEMKSIDLTDYNKQLVALGADSSIFVFNASPLDDNDTFKVNLLGNSYPSSFSDKWTRVVLQSDTYLEENDLKQVQYAICSTKPFRFLSFTVETENYNIMNNINGRSVRYNLYRAGSVFFLDSANVEKFKESIRNKKEFFQIGYNQYYQ